MVQTDTEIKETLLSCIRQLISCKEGRISLAAYQGELVLLCYVQHRGGLVLPSEISEAMSVSSSRIARLLNTLEAKGLVYRSHDTVDHRKVFVTLTDEGVRYTEEAFDRIHKRISAIIDALGEEDTEEFIRISKKIISISLALSSA